MKRLSSVILLASLGLFAACGGGGDGETVVIGYTGPLSGGASLYGRNVLDGIEMAVNEVNDQGGVQVGDKTLQVEVEALDDRYFPNESATNAKRLVHQYGAPVVMCPHSGGILAIQGFNTKQPEFLIGAYSSEPQILEQTNPLTLMIPPAYTVYFEPFAEKMLATHGQRLGMIPASHAYAKEWTKGFSKTWEKLGGTVLTNNEISYTSTTDFSSVVSKTLAEDPDVLFIGGPSQPTALVIKSAREQGFEGGFAIMDQAKFAEIEEIVPIDMLEGSVGIMPLSHYPTDNGPRFVKKFHRVFGEERIPNAEVALNYQAVHILLRAMALSGNADDPRAIRAKVNEAAQTLPEDYAAYEVVRVGEDGHVIATVVAAHVVDGQYRPMTVLEAN